MLTLRMVRGPRAGSKDPHSILLSESVAKSFFGDSDPVGQMMRLNNEVCVKVTGVREDLPHKCHHQPTCDVATTIVPHVLDKIPSVENRIKLFYEIFHIVSRDGAQVDVTDLVDFGQWLACA